LNKVLGILEGWSETLGKLFSWSSFILILIICFDVLMRYAFGRSIIWVVELEMYFFAFSFILTGAYAFKHDKHVRVDLFYTKWSKKKKAWTDLLGNILLLFPWCIVSIIVCLRYAMTSFKLGESSAQAGGLPALYILKFSIVLGFSLLLLQSFVEICKSIQIIRQKEISSE